MLRFIGPVTNLEILNTIVYRIHHRIASEWRRDRVFLMGDAAHLITPMWALGLNTGILDAINLPWRLAWVARGWADQALLDGYAREQQPVAAKGSGEMAEAARRYMLGQKDAVKAMSGEAWANALTRTMLGVRLDVDQSGDWSMVRTDKAALRVGERIPDVELHGAGGPPGAPARPDRRQLRRALFHRRAAPSGSARRPARPEASDRVAARCAAQLRTARTLAVRYRRPLPPARRMRHRHRHPGAARTITSRRSCRCGRASSKTSTARSRAKGPDRTNKEFQ